MCKRRKLLGTFSDEDMDEDSDSSAITTSNSSDESRTAHEISGLDNYGGTKQSDIEETIEDNLEDEDEDETIKAIKRECNHERNCPPNIQCEDFITDISFNPVKNILAVASIVGDVLLYQYNNQENTVIHTLELHTQSCRDIEFSQDGNFLYSTSKDKSIMISDVETGHLIHFSENSHDVPVSCLTVIDENTFSTGNHQIGIKYVKINS